MKRHVIMSSIVGLSGLAVFPALPVTRGGTSIHVCVGADLVLRFSPKGAACPQNQVGYDLSLDVNEPKPPKEDEPPPKEVVELQKTVDFLRDRVSNLEKELGKHDKNESDVAHIVRAPFHVVDKSGKPILTVTDDAVKQATGRVRIGRGSGDNYGVSIANPAGTLVAGLTEASNGAGGLGLYDQAGKLSVRGIGGLGVQLYSPSDKEIASFGFKDDTHDSGHLWMHGNFELVDGSGLAIVEAGTSPSGVGVVRVGPAKKCVPMATLRVPDCIIGRQP